MGGTYNWGGSVAINKVREAEAAATNAGDLGNIADIYAENIAHMAPDEPLTKGIDDARQTLMAMVDEFDIELEYVDSDIKVVGDWAIERYAGEVAMTQSVKGIHIYHRGEDGAWLITHDIWNSDAPVH